MTKVRTTLYVDEELDRNVERMAQRSTTADEVSDMSKSEVYRKVLSEGWEQIGALTDLLDEHERILQQRSEYIDGEAKLSSLRAGFEARCKSHLKNRFEQGIRESEVEDFAEGLKRDALILWPEDDRRRDEAIRYVDQLVSSMTEAMARTEYDPLDPETAFEAYESVAGELQECEAEQRADEIMDLWQQRVSAVGQQINVEDAATAIGSQLDLDESAVVTVIEARAATTPALNGGEADD